MSCKQGFFAALRLLPYVPRALRAAGLDIEAGGIGAEFNVTREEPSADAWRKHWVMCCQ
jgi:hypothetical protein